MGKKGGRAMNREKTAECIKIMQAFVDGKQIEFKDCMGHWSEAKNPLWDWDSGAMYRIKPKSEYRPFKNVEECWQEMLKHSPFGWVKSKNDSIPSKFIPVLNLRDNEASILNICFTYSDLVKYYTFADGTPFGIKEE